MVNPHDDVPPRGQRGIPTFGKVIKKQREWLNLSQEALGAKAGCDPRVIAQAERDGPTTLAKLHKIAKALNLGVDAIANINTPESRPSDVWYVDLTIRVNAPAGEFQRDSSRMKEFAAEIAEALKPFNSFALKNIRVGSVLLDYTMSVSTLNALCLAHDYSVLDHLNILSIQVRPEFRPDVTAERERAVEAFANIGTSVLAQMLAIPLFKIGFEGMPYSVIRVVRERWQADASAKGDDQGDKKPRK